jgi:hypothetical protein
MNAGPKIVEPVCSATRVETIYMVGNEREPYHFGLPKSSIKSGYSFLPEDKLIMQTQLQNLEDKEKWVWVTLEYEYLDGPQPDYKRGQTVWMTIGYPLAACGDPIKSVAPSPWGPSNITESYQPKSNKFSEKSLPWDVPKDGFLMKTGGHMHDGGTSTDIFHNGKMVCHSVPIYAKSAASMGGGHSHGGHGRRQVQEPKGIPDAEGLHIERQEYCTFPEGVPIKAGDSLFISANYDFDKYTG